jgi:hypothetical protein
MVQPGLLWLVRPLARAMKTNPYAYAEIEVRKITLR